MGAGWSRRQEAQELVECFLIKLNQFGPACVGPHYNAPFSWGWESESDVDAQVAANAAGPDGEGIVVLHRNDSMRNVTLGGQTPEGTDACNELTFVCLRAAGRGETYLASHLFRRHLGRHIDV